MAKCEPGKEKPVQGREASEGKVPSGSKPAV